MKLITSINNQLIVSPGEVIEMYSRCKTETMSKKCKKFYQDLFEQGPNDVFITCPCGMSAIKRVYQGEATIYTCFRENNTYKRKEVNQKKEKVFNPILEKNVIYSLIHADEDYQRESSSFLIKKRNFDNILHEVKKLNAIIKESCCDIFETYALDCEGIELDQRDTQNLFTKIRTIYLTSNLIYSKYALFDFETEPNSVKRSTPCALGVYKKFDKLRKIFKNYKYRGINIYLTGTSYKKIMMYESFDSIPLLLLDNAIKYSPTGENVRINFEEDNSTIYIHMESIGPYVEKDDLIRVFERGFRAKSAEKYEGNGIGLYFVKKICDLHSISINLDSDKKRRREIGGITCAPFIVNLKIENAFEEES